MRISEPNGEVREHLRQRLAEMGLSEPDQILAIARIERAEVIADMVALVSGAVRRPLGRLVHALTRRLPPGPRAQRGAA